jgi:hypothetical protein
MYFSRLQVTFEAQDIFTLSTKANNSYSCAESTAIASVVTLLSTSTAGSVTCNSQTWTVFTCSSVPSLCVNCAGTCSADSCDTTDATMVANPCMTCTAPRTSAYYITSLAYTTQILYPLLTVTDVSASKQSVSLDLNVSRAGRVYCAGFSSDYNVTSISAIKQSASILTASTPGVHQLDVTGLVASTTYTIYCYSEDFKSHIMPLGAITKRTVNTTCCRSITYSSFATRLTEQTVSSVNTFALDLLPSASTKVSIIWESYNCSNQVSGTSAKLTISPSTYTFTSASRFSYGTFVMKGSPGCYLVTTYSSSGSYYSNVTSKVTVNSLNKAPAPPVLSSATFSNDGRTMTVAFDSTTDKGATTITGYTGSFKCSLCLDFPGAANTKCLWTSSSQISAQISVNVTATRNLEIGSTVALLAKRVKTGSCPSDVACSYANASSVALSAPSSPVVPTVSLSTSGSIRSCDDLVIDPSGTTGSGGRSWKSVSWTVTGSGVNATTVTALNSYLTTNYNSGTTNLVTLPSSYLEAGTYTVQLQVMNFLDQSGTAEAVISVADSDNLYSVSIAGPSTVLTYRWQSLSLFAVANAQTCSGSTTSLTYSWSLYKDLKYQSVSSESKDQRFFKLSAYQLEAGTSYVVKVSISSSSSSSSSTSSTVVLQVGQSGTYAVIEGGASRAVSVMDTLKLDASSSYDIDYLRTKSLYYSWSCSEVSPNYGSSCPLFIDSGAVTNSVNGSDLFTSDISASYSSAEFTIVVVVSNDAGLSSSASVTLTILDVSLPTVSIAAPSKTKYNSGESVSLTGSITGDNVSYAVWSCESVTLSSTVAVTTTSQSFKAGTSSFSLALFADVLVAGLSYTFELSASYGSALDSEAAVANVTVLMNTPPSGGSLSVSPTTGEALTDKFFFSTHGWSDDVSDLPLSYVLSYYTVSSSSVTVVKNVDTTSYISSLVAQGLESLDYAVTCLGTAYDIYSGSGSATTTVTVTPIANASMIADAAASAVSDALTAGNPSAVSQVVGAVAGAVNSVNCTVPVVCSSLNRDVCSTTPNTCGSCYAYYIGADGDSNTACISEADDSGRRRLTNNVCTVDTDCFLGSCEIGICHTTQKSCPNNCSQAGNCLHLDANDDIVSSCPVTSSDCTAICNCTAGAYGSDCSLTWDEWTTKRDLRESMCASLYDTLDIQDVSSDVLASRATSIAQLLSDPTELSDVAVDSCVSALIYTIKASSDSLLSRYSSGPLLCLKALSNVLAKGTSLTPEMVGNITETLVSLATKIQGSQVVGESTPFSLTAASVRISTSVIDSSQSSNPSFTVPQTSLEVYVNESTNSFTLDLTTWAYSGSGYIGVSVLQFTTNPHSARTDSVSTGLLISPSSSAEAVSIDGLGFYMHVQNTELVSYPSVGPTTGSYRCDVTENDTPYAVSVWCANVQKDISLHCPGNISGHFNYSCPSSAVVPRCTIWDGSAYIANPHCHVVHYNSWETVCFCNSSAASAESGLGRRKLVTVSNSSLVELSTGHVTRYTSGGSGTFTPSPSHSSDDDDGGIVIQTHKRHKATLSGGAIAGIVIASTVVVLVAIWGYFRLPGLAGRQTYPEGNSELDQPMDKKSQRKQVPALAYMLSDGEANVAAKVNNSKRNSNADNNSERQQSTHSQQNNNVNGSSVRSHHSAAGTSHHAGAGDDFSNALVTSMPGAGAEVDEDVELGSVRDGASTDYYESHAASNEHTSNNSGKSGRARGDSIDSYRHSGKMFGDRTYSGRSIFSEANAIEKIDENENTGSGHVEKETFTAYPAGSQDELQTNTKMNGRSGSLTTDGEKLRQAVQALESSTSTKPSMFPEQVPIINSSPSSSRNLLGSNSKRDLHDNDSESLSPSLASGSRLAQFNALRPSTSSDTASPVMASRSPSTRNVLTSSNSKRDLGDSSDHQPEKVVSKIDIASADPGSLFDWAGSSLHDDDDRNISNNRPIATSLSGDFEVVDVKVSSSEFGDFVENPYINETVSLVSEQVESGVPLEETVALPSIGANVGESAASPAHKVDDIVSPAKFYEMTTADSALSRPTTAAEMASLGKDLLDVFDIADSKTTNDAGVDTVTDDRLFSPSELQRPSVELTTSSSSSSAAAAAPPQAETGLPKVAPIKINFSVNDFMLPQSQSQPQSQSYPQSQPQSQPPSQPPSQAQSKTSSPSAASRPYQSGVRRFMAPSGSPSHARGDAQQTGQPPVHQHFIEPPPPAKDSEPKSVQTFRENYQLPKHAQAKQLVFSDDAV